MPKVYYDAERGAFAVESGATLGKVYDTLFRGWGVTLPGGTCPAVGAGGHFAGGGYGLLSRRYGMVIDHLYAVEVVVVDESGKSRTVVATREVDDPDRDLWWAFTGGGGGNFGVVTRYWMRSPAAEGTEPSLLRQIVRARLGLVPDEIDGGHCGALARPHDLSNRLEKYRLLAERSGLGGSGRLRRYGLLVV